MDWKKIKCSAIEAVRAAKTSARELADSDTAKQAKRLAAELSKKSRTTTEQVLKSELAGKASDVGNQTARKSAQYVSEVVDWGQDKWRTTTEETHEQNWYLRSAKACENVSDAVMGNTDGVSSKISRGVAAKLGATGTAAGIFSVASLLGTASTGTAIGTLSGAAFTGASLAWIGGSVAAGTVILGVATVAGGIGAAVGAAWVSKKFLYGEKRKLTELEVQERKIVDACLALAIAFRKKAEAGSSVDTVSAKYLYGEALTPLCEELADLQKKVDSWPYMARQRLKNASAKLSTLAASLKEWSSAHPNVTTGVVSAVFLQLLAGDTSGLSSDELLVLDALRRSNHDLTHASDEQLANYVQGLEPAQLQGLQNNVKGIYHELRFVENENMDGDSYVAELFEATNHPGADVRITNLETGAVREVQLKATDYINAIKEHNSRYESIDVFATIEVSDAASGIESSGLSNIELTEDVEKIVEELDGYYEPSVLDSMGVAGLVALARNVRVTLKGRAMSDAERQRLTKDGAVSAGMAGLFSLILG
jgi:phage host-nuclease inhibitor protein Gam